MAKEKADSNKRGWFARWRERRAQSKRRADGISRRRYGESSAGAQRYARERPPWSGGGD
jgi:hypothetical protein